MIVETATLIVTANTVVSPVSSRAFVATSHHLWPQLQNLLITRNLLVAGGPQVQKSGARVPD